VKDCETTTGQLRGYSRGIRPTLPADPVVRFETTPGEQMQVDWVEFRKGSDPSTPSAPHSATAGQATSNSSST